MTLDSHGSMNPTVNYTRERAGLHAVSGNLMPGGLSWRRSSDANAREWLQTHTDINREFWLHRAIAELHQNSPDKHQVTTKLHMVEDFAMAGKLMYFSCKAVSGGRVYTGV